METLPNLKPDVLQQLTRNIEHSLRATEQELPKINGAQRHTKTEAKKSSDDRTRKTKHTTNLSKASEQSVSSSRRGKEEPKSSGHNDNVQSKKRLRNGDLKRQSQNAKDDSTQSRGTGRAMPKESRSKPDSKKDKTERTVSDLTSWVVESDLSNLSVWQTLEPLAEWHAAVLPALPQPVEDQKSAPRETVERINAYAMQLLSEENEIFSRSSRPKSSSHQFYTDIMASGTLSDKIGALTLSIQESPLHNMKSMETLLGLARKRSRAQAVEVLGALKDLFGPGNLLPSDRKLMSFVAHPELHAAIRSSSPEWKEEKPLPKPLTRTHLILWAFEDWLKSTFFQTLQILEVWCNDEVAFARGRAVDYIYSLLKEKPEQETNLLRLLVNKLGDKDKKISSQTSFRILQLMTAHPAMKMTIVSAIESDLIFRPGQSLHAQYYAAITLNQTVLSSGDETLTRKLVDVYFSLFLKILHNTGNTKKSDVDEKPPAKIKFNAKGEPQGGGSLPGKKALEKQAQSAKSTTAETELREKLLSAVLTGVNRAIPFISTSDEAFEKHIDTLFRITHSSNFNTSIQALMLIQQIQGANESINDRFYRTLYESLLDSRLLHSSKQVLYLNLLYRALRSDLNVNRVKAFSKRILQVMTMHQPSFTCGAIYLLRELENVYPSLQNFVTQQQENVEEGEESFKDVDEDAVSAGTKQSGQDVIDRSEDAHDRPTYDPRKRDPSHANASASTLWDISPFIHHYHPSVSLFATRLLSRDPMPPKPDLGLNTLIHFLDRFVYKNPKSIEHRKGLKGMSLMQPLASGDKSAVLVTGSGENGQSMPVNSDAFWKREVGDVGADEVFFHKYFSTLGKKKENRAERKKQKEKNKAADESDVDSQEDEEDEEEVWKALVDSKPEIEGDAFDEDDEGFSDLEDMAQEMEDLSDDEDEDMTNGVEKVPGESDDEELDFGESDLEALLDSDDEIPPELDENVISETGDVAMETSRDVSKGDKGKKSGRDRKKKLKHLPTFASAEDYEKMLGGDDEEGVA